MIKPLLMGVMALAVACCAVGPKYKAPTQKELGVPSKWSSEIPDEGTRMELSVWWQQLNDPVLSDLIDRAVKSGLDVRAAQARLRQARARRRIAGADLFPTVTGSASARRSESSTDSGSGTAFNAGFDADWELDIFGGIRRGVEAAQADLQATEADLYNTQISLIAEVALNYIEVRSFQGRTQIARSNLASQSETLQLTEWRAQAGLTSSVDVEQARANREQTAAQIPSLETSLFEAQYRLAILLGLAPGALTETLKAPGSVPAVPEQVTVGIPAEALAHRPDVRAAERTLAAETARVGQAVAARYPGLNLGGSIGLDAISGGPVEFAGSVIGSLFQTIFDRGRLREQVEIQSAVQQQALLNYQATVLTALEEVENALTSLANNRRRFASLQTAAEAARNAALFARQQYTSGLTDFQTVLDTERSVLSIEDSLLTTQAEQTSALIRLYKALGGGWTVNSAGPASLPAGARGPRADGKRE